MTWPPHSPPNSALRDPHPVSVCLPADTGHISGEHPGEPGADRQPEPDQSQQRPHPDVAARVTQAAGVAGPGARPRTHAHAVRKKCHEMPSQAYSYDSR